MINASAKRATAIHNGALPVVPDTTASIRATIANTKLIDMVEPPSGIYPEVMIINKHGDDASTPKPRVVHQPAVLLYSALPAG